MPNLDSNCVVIFDMGGVLYDFQGTRLIARASRRARRWRSEEIRTHWAELVRAFETGGSSELEFAELVVQRYQLTLTAREFIAEFRNAAVGFFEGALSLVAELCGRHRVLSLSNTNPVQWQKVLADLGPSDPFHGHHPSHLSGFQKPDPLAFEGVSGVLPPGTTCHYFDDRRENVQVANGLGWCAHHVRGVAQTRQACQRAGLF